MLVAGLLLPHRQGAAQRNVFPGTRGEREILTLFFLAFEMAEL